MLVLLGCITPEDYREFEENFDRFSQKRATGRLTQDDLRDICAELKNKREAVRRASLLDGTLVLQGKLHQLATQLIFPAGLFISSFVWHTVYGYLLVASGLINGLVIGSVLGHPISSRRLRITAALALSGLVPLVGAWILLLLYMVNPREFVDALEVERLYGFLDSDGLTRAVPAYHNLTEAGLTYKLPDRVADQLVEQMHKWDSVLLLVLYLTFLLWPLVLNLKIAIACLRFRKAKCSDT